MLFCFEGFIRLYFRYMNITFIFNSVSAVDFFNQINMLYGTITEFCTEESCPIMSAGPKYEYHWADGHTVKKPIKCSAPKYIDYLMTWVQDQLDDETLFPSKIGKYLIVYVHLLFIQIWLVKVKKNSRTKKCNQWIIIYILWNNKSIYHCGNSMT